MRLPWVSFCIIVMMDGFKYYKGEIWRMKDRLLDIFLLPRTAHQKVTDKKGTLYAGILFVGAVDMAMPLIARYLNVFRGKPLTALNYNIGLILLFAVMLGIIDVMFFSLPLFDLFKFLKKGAAGFGSSALIRFAKAYITAHLVVIPFNILFLLLLYNPMGAIVPVSIQLLAMIYFYFIMPAWFSGIIARGVNVQFGIEPRFRPLAFAVIFTWNYLLGNYALDYVINNWVMYFFK